MSSLTDKDIKALQPKDHHYRVALGDGLFLWISSSGKKSWQYRYHVHSNNVRKEKIYTIGDFQQINLSHERVTCNTKKRSFTRNRYSSSQS